MVRRVAVLFGGPSGEHEISVRSAAAVIDALDDAGLAALPVGIAKSGRWWTTPAHRPLLERSRHELVTVPDEGDAVRLGGPGELARPGGGALPFDVVFPVLHGTFGEDGTVQGMLDGHGAAYVGAGVAASALCMDKILTKHVLHDAGIPTCRWVSANVASGAVGELDRSIAETFGYPCFVKPANSGSSVGITKVHDRSELDEAWADAARYDDRIIAEEAIDGRELECGVIGNAHPEASVVGELIPSREFYDYVDKYVMDATTIDIPAQLPPETATRVRTLAVAAFRLLDCSGLARIDFFLDRRDGAIYLNEPNTMPGFTRVSMFPKLWDASGLEFPALVTRLVDLAEERHAQRATRRGSLTPPVAAGDQ
jgi:D-alanine-D-alanine ligase